MPGIYLMVTQTPELFNERVPSFTASCSEVASEHREMPLTVIDIVLPVVMESQLESTLDILCILESYAKLMQEVVGFAYHGGLLILAGRHNPFDLRRDAGVLLRPSLPFPSWLI
ncbi:orf113a (mitochondrion) [Brassica oleracea]|uniref:ORF113a n=7 Tax=Brassica TaxID=3705 RepID=F8K8P7_BRANA|nr:orf113a [Brassica oleracea]YP_004927730.1 orf113a [Brassica juncea]YP_004927827.1 orf113a [Brassica rapa subsp. oleifera]YP_009907439.1 hypothetical protein [Brassica rapa]AHY20306.1 hypothetical protein [Brassica juncea var. tumida]AIZ06158.1 hypothetical protein [Brassica napus]AOW69018.1 orf113a [Brassica oleracea var. capitata]AEH43402.1 orf113a [Brassica rapa subsp. oleifera]AEH43534.1 orf113a [Brassica oleracea]